MALSFIPNISHRHAKKGGRINPHHFWNIFVICFLVTLTAIIILTTLFFARLMNHLDAPALPRLDTSARPLEKIKIQIEKAETAVHTRTGQ